MARIAEFHSVDGGSIPPCSTSVGDKPMSKSKSKKRFLRQILYGAGGISMLCIILTDKELESSPHITVDGEELVEQHNFDLSGRAYTPHTYHPAWELIPASANAALLKQNFNDPLCIGYTGGPGRHRDPFWNIKVSEDHSLTLADMMNQVYYLPEHNEEEE